MATIVDWKGVEYTNNLLNYIDPRMQRLADRLKENVKANAPVDSGDLKDSIEVEKVKRLEYRVQSDKDYAIYIEYGTSTTSAQPYFRPALSSLNSVGL